VCQQLEKVQLIAEICSESTVRERKNKAIIRYSEVVAELRKITHDIEMFERCR
jgi:hypothetical protein